MLLAWSVFDVDVVFGKAFNSHSHFAYWLLQWSQPLHSNVVGANFEQLTKNVAAKMAQKIDKRKHFFESYRGYSL